MSIKLQKITKEPRVIFDGISVNLPNALQKKINKYWDKLASEGRQYFNGEIFSLKKIKEKKDGIKILMLRTSFAHYLYARKSEKDLGVYSLKTVFSSCLIITNDEKILLGKMGKHTSLAGRYQLIGGGLDDNDLKDNIFDMKHSAIKELNEELGIDAGNKHIVRKMKIAYLKTGGNNNIAIIYKVMLNKTADEFFKYYKKFEKRLQAKNELPEFAEVIALPMEKMSIENFISKNKNIMAEYLPKVLLQTVKDN